MTNLYNTSKFQEALTRIEKLTPTSKGQWGKMDVAQMLAHLNVAYEMAYERKHKKPGAFGRLMLKLFVKNAVVGPKPYKKNTRTAPQFIISDTKDFEKEKQRLLSYMHKTKDLGEQYFEGRENLSFGPMSAREWNMLFSKHLDHHLTQFGV